MSVNIKDIYSQSSFLPRMFNKNYTDRSKAGYWTDRKWVCSAFEKLELLGKLT